MQVNIPIEWLEVMEELWDKLPDANVVLAGGCFRDLVHEKEIKDMDIFVSPKENSFLSHMDVTEVIRRILGRSRRTLYMEYINHETEYLMEYGKYQIITLKPGFSEEEILSRFDFGICQIGLFRDKQVHFTEAFSNDYNNKTFTLVDPHSKERSKVRAERFKLKYPEHRFIL